jgi:TRAP-type C4-dicarboxylate transport system permease small subunit
MRFLDRFLRAMALLAGLVLLALMLFTVLDVVMRYFFNAPFRGSLEATEFAMALIVFLSLSYCGWQGGHIAVDLFEGYLRAPVLRLLPAAIAFIGAGLFALIAYQLVVETSHSWSQVSNMLRVMHWPFKLVAAFGSALFAVVLLLQGIEAARGARKLEKAH